MIKVKGKTNDIVTVHGSQFIGSRLKKLESLESRMA